MSTSKEIFCNDGMARRKGSRQGGLSANEGALAGGATSAKKEPLGLNSLTDPLPFHLTTLIKPQIISSMKKVAVGSLNPVKIASVKNAFTTAFPQESWEFVGIDVSSGVSHQPLSEIETITGARNRAHKALQDIQADFGVGLEGGMNQIDGKWFDCGWIVVVDASGIEGMASSVRMSVPEKFIKIIRNGKELGHATDELFDTENSKQDIGYFGLMTNGHLTREKEYTDAVIAALTKFLHPHLF